MRFRLRIQQPVQLFRLPLDAQALLINPVPGGGQGQRSGLALQQGHAESLLQTLQPSGNRRLGNSQIFRRLIEGRKLYRRQQGVNVVDAHRILNVNFAY